MARCKACDEEIEDNDVRVHVQNEHADVCDEYLQEYIPDSIDDAEEELIDYE